MCGHCRRCLGYTRSACERCHQLDDVRPLSVLVGLHTLDLAATKVRDVRPLVMRVVAWSSEVFEPPTSNSYRRGILSREHTWLGGFSLKFQATGTFKLLQTARSLPHSEAR
jgi:hypothetical protein